MRALPSSVGPAAMGGPSWHSEPGSPPRVHRRWPGLRWLRDDSPVRRRTWMPVVSRAAARSCGAVLLHVVLACGGSVRSSGTKSGADSGRDSDLPGSADSASSASGGAGSGGSSGSAGSSGVASSSGGSSGSGSSGASSAFARSCGTGVDCAPPNNPDAPPGLVCRADRRRARGVAATPRAFAGADPSTSTAATAGRCAPTARRRTAPA